jgi:hypothetical protein
MDPYKQYYDTALVRSHTAPKVRDAYIQSARFAFKIMLQRYDLYKTSSLIYAKNNWILTTQSGLQLQQFGGHRLEQPSNLVGVHQFIGARCQLASGLISRIAFDLACATKLFPRRSKQRMPRHGSGLILKRQMHFDVIKWSCKRSWTGVMTMDLGLL